MPGTWEMLNKITMIVMIMMQMMKKDVGDSSGKLCDSCKTFSIGLIILSVPP